MQGTTIHFDSGGAKILWESAVTGFAALVQNALVNIATDRGSDDFFPDKGTEVYRSGARGNLIDFQAARHASNFAALRTLFFSRRQDVGTTEERLDTVKLDVTNYTPYQLQLNASFTGTQGSSAGTDTTLVVA